jgi:hypothetical protein
MLRPTLSHPVYFGVRHPSEYHDQIFIAVRHSKFVDMGPPLWREDESVAQNFCWLSLAQSLSDPSPAGLTPILYCLRFELKLKLNYDRQTVGQSVLVSDTHLGLATNFSFSLKIFFRHLRVWYFIARSLTRERVCNLLLLLDLASAVPLGSESRGTQDHILLSQFLRLPPSPRMYIPQKQVASV